MSEYPGRDKWGVGPWQHEPDNAYWSHVDYLCLALRHPELGNWCGYVVVPPNHPFWAKRYGECLFHCEPDPPPKDDDSPIGALWSEFRKRSPFLVDHDTYSCAHRIENLIDVHGGATYGSFGNEFIAHPKAMPSAWYIGFDCGHAWDYSPGLRALTRELDLKFGDMPFPWGEHEVYRDLAYVTKEVNNLAEQVAGFGLPLYKATSSALESDRESP